MLSEGVCRSVGASKNGCINNLNNDLQRQKLVEMNSVTDHVRCDWECNGDKWVHYEMSLKRSVNEAVNGSRTTG